MSAIDVPQRGGLAAIVDRFREAGVGYPARRGATSVAGVASWPGAEMATQVEQLFARGLHENSNLEQDWLWLATIVTGEGERRYCLERALYINPQSAEARVELARLDRRHGIPPIALWRRGA